MSIGSTGGSTPPFTAAEMVPLYALASATEGAASPELLMSLETAAQIADREAVPTATQPPAPAAPPDVPGAPADPAGGPAAGGRGTADAAAGRSARISVYA